MSLEQFVKCPTCNGTKTSPFVKTNPCQTCKSVGQITVSHYTTLERIKNKIKSKIENKV